MPHEEKESYYVLELLKDTGGKAAETAGEMAALRKKLEACM